MTIAGPRKGDTVLDLRRVFVWSSGNAQAAITNRNRKFARATDDLDKVTRGLGGRYYNTTGKVTTKVAAIARDRRVGNYLQYQVGTDANDKPTLVWNFDQTAIDAEAATDGWYALLTNLTPTEASTAEVLVRYKGQEVVERRYSDFKGPLAVAPMMLKNNRRIQALITVICLALLVFCLVERRAPRHLAGHHHDRPLSRTPSRETHRAPRLRRPLPHPAHPGHTHQRRSHPPTIRDPTAPHGPARRRPAHTRLTAATNP